MAIRQDRSPGNYRAVVPIASQGEAFVVKPEDVENGNGVSFAEVTVLVDGNGVPISNSNPLATTATISGDISVSTGATAHAAPQTYVDGTSNPLQADLQGNLKVNVATPLPAGANTIGNVGIAGTANVAITNASLPVTGSVTATLAAGANAIGSVSVTGAVTANIANAIMGHVSTSAPLYVNGTNQPLSIDETGALRVTGGGGGGGNPAAGPIGDPIPTDGSLTAFEDVSGDLVAVSAANPLPVSATLEFPDSIVAVLADGANTIGAISGIDSDVTVVNDGVFAVQVTNTVAVTGTVVASVSNATIAGTVNVAVANAIQGHVSTSAPTYSDNTNQPLSMDGSGNLRVAVTGGGSNPAAGPTGSPVPASASFSGFEDVGGDLVGVSLANPLPVTGTFTFPDSVVATLAAGANAIGSITNTSFGVTGNVAVNPAGAFPVQVTNTVAVTGTVSANIANAIMGHVSTASPTYSDNTNQPISIDGSGNLRVIAVGGSGNPAAGLTGDPVPTSASLTGFEDVGGDLVNVSAATPLPVTGTFEFPDEIVSVLAAGANAIGSITNTSFGVTGNVAVNPAGLFPVQIDEDVVVTNDGTFAVQVDNTVDVNVTGPIIAVLANSANTIGSISNASFGVTGNVAVVAAGAFPVQIDAPVEIAGTVQVVNEGSFAVQVDNTVDVAISGTPSVTIANAIMGHVSTAAPTYSDNTNQPLSIDEDGNLRVVTVGGGGGGNPAAGPTGSPVPADGSYTAFATPGGDLIGVSAANPLPVIANATIAGSVTVTQSNAALLNVSSYTATTQVQVNPTVTAGAYVTNNVVGGKLTFANATRVGSGVLQALTVTSKSINAGAAYKFYLFTTDPTNSTWTDHANASINAADIPFLVDVIAMPSSDSSLGTCTLTPTDNLGRSFKASGTSLYGVLVTTGAVTYSSTSDVFVTMTVLND